MELQERVYSVLIVSAADSFNDSIAPLLPETKFSPIRFETSISSAKRTLLERAYDFVVINSPLPDDIGLRFAIDVCEKSTVVLLMVRAELYSPVYEKVSPYGVYVLSKPTSKPVVSNAIDWMSATRERLRRLEKKTVSIEDKMQEIRIVNRAKWLLIDNLKMTESDAHRYIEKQAMDRCVAKSQVADEIIRTYG